MDLIVKKLKITGKLEIEMLFDTGTRNPVIRKDIAEKIATIMKFEPKTFESDTIGTNMSSGEEALSNNKLKAYS